MSSEVRRRSTLDLGDSVCGLERKVKQFRTVRFIVRDVVGSKVFMRKTLIRRDSIFRIERQQVVQQVESEDVATWKQDGEVCFLAFGPGAEILEHLRAAELRECGVLWGSEDLKDLGELIDI